MSIQSTIKKRVGVMGAMPEEINGIVDLISSVSMHTMGGRTYYTGRIDETEVVVAFSRWGKVAAASTALTMIIKFDVTEIIFTGVAGGISDDVNIGDIVVANRSIQHDMDARPLMKQFEIPMLGKQFFDCCPTRTQAALELIEQFVASKNYMNHVSASMMSEFSITHPVIHIGAIASGDKFISTASQKSEIRNALPDVKCSEMEGAAVAQVCYEHDVPYVLIRVVSDLCDGNSIIDFPAFIKQVSSQYAKAIIKAILRGD
jgi:adenosylhomocysteine nucleosidase